VKVLICGYGFVGQAHELAFERDHEVYIYDPAKGHTLYAKPDAVIIAVSTPMNADGSCNIANVIDCISMIPSGTPILIKSTISLSGWDYITRDYPHEDICFSPEFLRAEHAMEDFNNQKDILIGGKGTNFWIAILSELLPNVKFITADARELILAKYTRNSFLALKVAFFNQIHDLCDGTGVDYDSVVLATGMDERIGYSHTQVTKERGFGGHCLPKDSSALVEMGRPKKYTETVMTILEEAIKYNKRLTDE
jgi:UDPglucose 6-dehydrogenase|tara:strand:+ start:171 stop:926 length:756 start_codon:yes stop_codon:yes gene_type:complete